MEEKNRIKDNQTLNKADQNKGFVIAELIDKTIRKTKNGETFYILEISIRKSLTETYFELRNETNLTLTNGSTKLFAFANENRNKFAYRLEDGCIYAFWFVKSHNSDTKEDYFHVKDWKKLAPNKKYIERSFKLISGKKDESENEEYITNQELLLELRKRQRAKSISFKLSIVNSGSDGSPLEFDAELKDEESNFSIDLQND